MDPLMEKNDGPERGGAGIPDRPADGAGGAVVEQRTISTDLAQRLVGAGLEYGRQIGRPLTIAVVDSGGLLVSFVRMVGAPIATNQTAHDKAWTSVATRRPTHHWSEIMRTDEPLRWGVSGGIPRVVVFGGGYPITVNGDLVGGLGVSGAHHEIDRIAAEAILEMVGLEIARPFEAPKGSGTTHSESDRDSGDDLG
jgi:uncharacterized protein GlcG (DUF336 family)